MRARYILFIVIYIFCNTTYLHCQVTESTYDAKDRPKARAIPINVNPIIDGEVMDDEIWKQIPPFGDFYQVQPNFGKPASEKTEIRIAYTSETFFLSVICYDSQPDKLVVSDPRRDANLDNTDAFIFVLDTYKDGQNGFVFGTNSLGIEYDAQVDNEGQGNRNVNRQQSGTIGGFNLNWDASFTVKAQVKEYGWSAEFAIPLRTIRFQAGKDWGINFRRNIRKTNEIVYWAQMPIGFTLYRLSLAGTLTGLELRSPGNLKLIPYVLGRLDNDYASGELESEVTPEIGGDIKYSITPSLTLDLTYNTDFAQVEVDDQQVNLDRFNLFFPEKRPFFLENAGLFTVGSPGEVDLFFSRRIGIGDDGSIVPIIGGARLSGKLNRTNVGLLTMFTDAVNEEGIEKNNFSVARVNYEFKGRTALGGIFVNRTGLESEDDYNRTYSLDGKLGLGKKARLSGFYAQTSGSYDTINEHAFKLQADYNWDNWEMRAAYTEVGQGFNPEVGFLLRSAFRKPEGLVLYHLRPKNENSKILEYRPHVSYRGYWNFNGFQETGFLHMDNHWEFKSGTEIHTGINLTTEGLLEPFEISEGVIVEPGTYKHAEGQLIFFTNASKPVSVNIRSVFGGSFGGTRYLNTATLQFRAGEKFNAGLSYQYNKFELPGGDFTANVFQSRITYAFKSNVLLQGLVQNNTVNKLWAFNFRFGWLQRANTGLFVVYNYNIQDNDPLNNSLIIKYTRIFDLVK
ncbi:MAG: carbohydrate binding family 9 domain-containing protein [Eudoraea sp.]|nr:carbohydrate binding family 9 domain-containing protein [Eudoraea sp.]MBT8293463.1 carbohydrate binding family 9 domain-containing protein [Eudoraea sp.]NNL01241.1 carbohydrate binding family 9 domain-containing protein [Eudoraea sp.]